MTNPQTTKIKVTKKKEVTEEIEVTFPVYTRFDCVDSEILIKTRSDRTYVMIKTQEVCYSDGGHKYDESVEIEFGEGWGWLPHDDVQVATAEEFQKACDEARSKLERALI